MIGKVQVTTVDVSQRFLDRLIHRRDRIEAPSPAHELVIARAQTIFANDMTFMPQDPLDMAVLLAWELESDIHQTLGANHPDLGARCIADQAVYLAVSIATRLIASRETE